MLLALDIGNTNIKSALFSKNDLIQFKVHSDVDAALKYIGTNTFSEAAICSVNPNSEKNITEVISTKGLGTFIVNVNHKINLKIIYKTPDTLGMDRVCSAAGALDLAKRKSLINKNQYLITIDFGTATTINIVTPDGRFLGGLIAPGIKTMLNSLKEKTAHLPLIESGSYEGIIGDSTNSSILSGVITSTIGMISEVVNQLRQKGTQPTPLIFTTGGNAELIVPHLKQKIIFEKDLVLRGLKVIYDLNK